MERVRALGGYPELAPGALGAVVFVVWATSDGGFEPTSWYPGALFLLGLLATTLIGYRCERLPRATLLALACLAGFTLWSYASIAWAGVQGDAWDGANRSLLYLMVFAVFALPAWRPSSAAAVLGLYSVAIAVVGGVSLIDAAGSDDPIVSFISGRFAEPMGYHNANAALFIGAFWPALFLASRAETPWPARPLLLAVAGLLAELALLPQSRGSAIAFPIALAIYLAIVPNRVRSLIVLLPVGAAVALTATPVLDVYDAAQGGGLADAIDSAVGAMAVSFVALLAVGAAIALVDRGLEVPERTARVAGGAVGIAGGMGVIVALVLAIAAIGNPASWAEDRWEDFKGGYSEAGFGSTRFSGSLGSNRYDFWRVSLGEFADSPVAGVGADNFAVDYLRERESNEEPEQPHSLPVRVVTQTGIVGATLFAGFIVIAVAAAVRLMRRAPCPFARALAGVSVATFAYWFVHSSGDWFWVYPALTAPAFAWLALAGRLDSGGSPAGVERPSRGGPPAAVLAGIGVVAAVLAAASLLLPWGAARDVDRATALWATDPQAAYDRLDRASELDFLSEEPDLLAGAIAARYGDRKQMRDSFTRALERNPDNWYALLELGAIDAIEGRRSDATTRLAEAQRLNPREPLIRRVRRGAESGRAVSLRRIDAEFLRRVCARVGRTETTRYCE